MSQEIFDKLKLSVENLDEDAAVAAATEAVEAKLDAVECIEKGLAQGMNVISDQFDEGEVFIPQLIIAAKVFDSAVNILTKDMSEADKKSTSRGKVLFHTVQGDIHSIGKNICVTMLKASGFEVIDMGSDVAVEAVVEKAQAENVDIIAGSALMTTTMPAMKDIESLLKEQGIKDKFFTMYGGAPVNGEWVGEIGGSGYSDTATGCVKLAMEFMAKK